MAAEKSVPFTCAIAKVTTAPQIITSAIAEVARLLADNLGEIDEPEPAKEPHDLVVEMGRARKMIDGSALLDDRCLKPVMA